MSSSRGARLATRPCTCRLANAVDTLGRATGRLARGWRGRAREPLAGRAVPAVLRCRARRAADCAAAMAAQPEPQAAEGRLQACGKQAHQDQPRRCHPPDGAQEGETTLQGKPDAEWQRSCTSLAQSGSRRVETTSAVATSY